MTSNAYAKVRHKQPYSIKNALAKGAIAACAVSFGFSVVTHYSPNSAKAETKTVDLKKHRTADAKASFIKVNPMSYTIPKPYAKTFVIDAYSGDRYMNKNEKINKSEFSELTSFPVVSGGKLPVGRENDYSINNSRELVDISHKVKKISMPVVYGGKLPVRRER